MAATEALRAAAPLYYGGLRALGVTALNRRLKDAALVLCYHNVVAAGGSAEGDPAVHMAADRFAAQMRWVAARYRVVPLGDLVARLASGGAVRSLAAITFDDAYAGVFAHALPVLDALGLPATVFVVADAVRDGRTFWWDRPEVVASATPERRERWLTAARGDGAAIAPGHAPAEAEATPGALRPADGRTLREWLGRRVEYGVHSATHRSLPTLTDDELFYEVVRSREIVYETTGVRPDFFAYPYGRWDARVRATVAAAGYRAAFTLDPGLNRAAADPWALRRVNVPAAISPAAFEAWTGGLQARR
jgi:peptidoglycan/xylan/chitin deacetylase (PgdA/CDA1 family)